MFSPCKLVCGEVPGRGPLNFGHLEVRSGLQCRRLLSGQQLRCLLVDFLCVYTSLLLLLITCNCICMFGEHSHWRASP